MNNTDIDNTAMHTTPTPKKRGRKPKNSQATQSTDVEPQPLLKKRGRKPKGGKLVTSDTANNGPIYSAKNVILHLKCSTKDMGIEDSELSLIDPLTYNPNVPPHIKSYDPTDHNQYFNLKHQDNQTHIDNNTTAYPANIHATSDVCSTCNTQLKYNNNEDNSDTDNIIETKLRELKISFYRNNVHDKRSACFWCTYEFDNQPCYIPKYQLDGEIFGYWSFCRPPCAVAHLISENIDDSIKFEQYQLLNHIYGKIYNYKKNIRPAPDPHMLLEKFYGNMNIKEYRRLLNSDRVLLVVDKPMTRILPELHEENDDTKKDNGNGYNQSGIYKVKKNSEKRKGPSNTEIIMDTFGR